MKDIRETAYQRYKLWWLLENGFDMYDLETKAIEWKMDDKAFPSFIQHLQNTDFGGKQWFSVSEFHQKLYPDRKFMKTILTKEQYETYETDRNQVTAEKIKEIQNLVDILPETHDPRYLDELDTIRKNLDQILDKLEKPEVKQPEPSSTRPDFMPSTIGIIRDEKPKNNAKTAQEYNGLQSACKIWNDLRLGTNPEKTVNMYTRRLNHDIYDKTCNPPQRIASAGDSVYDLFRYIRRNFAPTTPIFNDHLIGPKPEVKNRFTSIKNLPKPIQDQIRYDMEIVAGIQHLDLPINPSTNDYYIMENDFATIEVYYP